MCCSSVQITNYMPWSILRLMGSSSEELVGEHSATRDRQPSLTLRRPAPRDILFHYPLGAIHGAPHTRISLTATRKAAAWVFRKRHGGLFDECVRQETGPRTQDDHLADLTTGHTMRNVGRNDPPSGGVTLGLQTGALESTRHRTVLSSWLPSNISAVGPETADSRRNV